MIGIFGDIAEDSPDYALLFLAFSLWPHEAQTQNELESPSPSKDHLWKGSAGGIFSIYAFSLFWR